MKQFKTVFYIIYFIFFAATFFFALNQDYMFEVGISRIFGILRIWAIVGAILLAAEWITVNIHIRQLKKKVRTLEKENLSLKAKMFDHEEEKKDIDRSMKSFGDSLEKKKEKKKDEDQGENL